MRTVEAAAEVRQAQEGRQRSNTSPEVGRVGGAQRPPKEPAGRNALESATRDVPSGCALAEDRRQATARINRAFSPESPSYPDPGPRSIACAVALIVSALAMLALG